MERTYMVTETCPRCGKIAQLVILPIVKPRLNIVTELKKTDRGNGGFGSTGK